MISPMLSNFNQLTFIVIPVAGACSKGASYTIANSNAIIAELDAAYKAKGLQIARQS